MVSGHLVRAGDRVRSLDTEVEVAKVILIARDVAGLDIQADLHLHDNLPVA